MKDLNIRQLTVLCDLFKVMYFLQAADHLSHAKRLMKCAKPLTIKEAEGTTDLINLLFPDREVSPMQFMKSVDKRANDAIEAYNEYKNWLHKFPGNKRILESFCKWFISDKFDSLDLKLHYNYIIYIACALIGKRTGVIDDKEFETLMNECIRTRNQIFGYRRRSVARAYFLLRDKINEIETKVKSRDPGPMIDYSKCPF